MSAPGDSKPSTVEHAGTSTTGSLGREEDAKLWLENTSVSMRTAWLLIASLLLTIVFVPAVQLVHETRAARDGRPRQASEAGRFPSFNILRLVPGAHEARDAHSISALDALLPSPKDLRAYEDTLEDQSVVASWILPRAQFLLTDVLGAGNEQVYKGRGNWLFYRSDVDYATGPGFLTQTDGAARDRELPDRHVDPVSAIEDFDRQLRARGIRLIVVPAAAKPTIHPDMMSQRYDWNSPPVQNPSYREFVRCLRSKGIPVFDTTSVLIDARNRERRAQYLTSDTHWTPSAVEEVAGRLGEFIAKEVHLPSRRPVYYSRLDTSVTGIGDTAVMLKLPEGADAPYRSTEMTHQVRRHGGLWKPERDANILFLGDSFSNIYSLKGMGWGESAGLVEQLSYKLGRPIDKIAINAGGAYAARDALRRQLARDPNRLAGKCVVVYEFAARELASGDWKMLPLPQTDEGRHRAAVEAVRGTAAALARSVAPAPGSPEKPSALPQTPSASTVAQPGATGSPTPTTGIGVSGAKPLVANPPSAARSGDASSSGASASQGKARASGNPVAEDRVTVQATVAGKAEVPTPGTVPYADCVIAVHLRNISVLQGKMAAEEIVVFVWGMRGNRLTPAAAYTVGQRVTLKLKPWAVAEPTYGSYNRVELEDDDLLSLDVFWGEDAR